MNKIELIGRLTKDLDLKYTQSQKAVLSFTVAINKRINGENSTDFINCVAWNNTAEFISKYFNKGQAIAVVGRLQNRSYEDNNGQKRYITEVIAEEAEFVGSKSQEKEDTEKQYEDFYENNNVLPF